MDFDRLDDWLAWQQTVNPRTIDLKLERVRQVAARLGLPRPKCLLTVGGTNGKGSTVAMLESILSHCGRTVGTYTSPHLLRYNERIRIAREPVADADIVRAFRALEAVRGDVPLTYFEFATLAAMWLFAQAPVDAILLEVGLGGRLDAVNAFEPDGVIIASVDLDHQSWLGDDRETIGYEKAGIMRRARPAVFSGADIPASVTQHAAAVAADLRIAGRDFSQATTAGGWRWQGSARSIDGLPLPSLPGAHQLDNAAGALALLEALGFDAALRPATLARALQDLRLAGRQQRLGTAPEWIVDVAHNTHAGRALAQTLAAARPAGRTFALVGMLADKAAADAIATLAAEVDEWLAVGLAGPRGLDATKLALTVANATGRPCEVADSIDAAVAALTARAGAGDRVVVFGSFRLAGPVLQTLGL